MRIDSSLKDALTWRFVVVAFLPMLIVSLWSFHYFSRDLQSRLARENLSLAESFAAQISLQLREPSILFGGFSHLLSPLVAEKAKLNPFLDELVEKSASIESIYLVNAQGQILAAGLPLELRPNRKDFISQELPLQPLLKTVELMEGMVWSQTFLPDLSGKQSLTFASAVGDVFVVGYFSLSQLVANFANSIDFQAYHLSLLDQQGRVIFQLPADPEYSSPDLSHLAPVQVALAAQSGSGRYRLAQQSYLGSAVPVPPANWLLLLGQNEEIVTSAIWRLKTIFVFGFGLAVLLSALWSRTLAKQFARPISQLAEGVKSFADGHSQHPLPHTGHREIDELSDSFQRMREAIDDREKLLHKNREYFSHLFNGISDAVFISERLPNGLPGRYLEVNDVACRMLGYQREELIRLSPYETNRTSQDDPEAFQAILDDISAHGKTLFKTEFYCKDGSSIPVEVSTQIFDLGQRPVFFAVARDITLREKYESSIKTLVRSTVGLTGQACLDEIVQNLCAWLNADGASIGLLQDGELKIQSSCIDGQLIGPYELAVANTPCAEVIADGFVFYPDKVMERYPALRDYHISNTCGFIGISMSDRYGRVLGVISAFSRTPMPLVPHVEELLAVIASRAAAECERMDYEKELTYSEEMLRTLFNSTAEAIVGIDLDGQVTFCNPAALRLLGYADDGLVGKVFHLLAHAMEPAEGSDQQPCPFISAIQLEEKIFVADETFYHRSGAPLPVEYWGHPMYQGGELVGGVITFLDISQRRTLEQQLQHSQRMEAIGTLTGGIAHDFNNILTVITGYAGLLQSQCQDDTKLLPKINKIAEAAERGSKLTHGLLAYSRKKSGPSTAADLNHLVLQVQNLFGKVIGERIHKQISLAEEQLVVLADTSQLEQVLVNLATNARDAMPDGGTLTIKTSKTIIDQSFCARHGYGEPGDYALITVADTGSGMPNDVQQKIFDPFYTTKDTGKGTGLGLAIAWGIIKQHKGYILVDSQPGSGSLFSIYLPLSGKQAMQQVLASNQQLPGGTETILLVEDDQLVRESTYSILAAVGYQVVTADCADAALKILHQRHHDLSLILSDVVMPGMKGTEFYTEIRKLTTVPVIFISGYTFDALREQGLVEEGVMLLNKPIQPVDLLTCVRETLNQITSSMAFA